MPDNNILKDLIVPIINVAAFLISTIALLISVCTLYLTQLSRAKISFFAGSYLNLGHFKEGNFQLTMPLLFVNDGVKTGVISRIALLVQQTDSDDGYLLEPYYFQKINEEGHFQSDSQFSHLAIAGKQNSSKLVLFRSSEEKPNEFQLLNEGVYKFTLLGWIGSSINPNVTKSFSVIISQVVATQLHADFKNKNGHTTRIIQEDWCNWGAKAMSGHKIRNFLGGDTKA